MRLLRFLCGPLFLLLGCSPEAIELVRFAADAGAEGEALDADTLVDADSIVDARAANDAGNTDAESAGFGRPPCEDQNDCALDAYCAKQSCGSKLGFCQRRTEVCGGEQAPVCGCDGITYFNDCLRRSHGVNIASEATCIPRQCGDFGGSCPEPAFCWRRASERTGGCRSTTQVGTCWVVPSLCGFGSDGGDRYDACEGPERCLSACEAIQSQALVIRAGRCMQQPRSGPSDYAPGP